MCRNNGELGHERSVCDHAIGQVHTERRTLEAAAQLVLVRIREHSEWLNNLPGRPPTTYMRGIVLACERGKVAQECVAVLGAH